MMMMMKNAVPGLGFRISQRLCCTCFNTSIPKAPWLKMHENSFQSFRGEVLGSVSIRSSGDGKFVGLGKR